MSGRVTNTTASGAQTSHSSAGEDTMRPKEIVAWLIREKAERPEIETHAFLSELTQTQRKEAMASGWKIVSENVKDRWIHAGRWTTGHSMLSRSMVYSALTDRLKAEIEDGTFTPQDFCDVSKEFREYWTERSKTRAPTGADTEHMDYQRAYFNKDWFDSLPDDEGDEEQ